MSTDQANTSPLRDSLAQILIENTGAREPQGKEDFLRLVAGAATVRAEAEGLMSSAVIAARSAGATWLSIGTTLGMTKQAAQKRFAPPADPRLAELNPNERTIGPITSFDEMKELALAGRYGWHSVNFGVFHHDVIRSETQWEHLRVTISPEKVRQLVTDGWELIGSSFPYSYLKRDTNLPAERETKVSRI